jgi:cytochrome d ubiquinol oxidase subunit I
MVCLGAHFSAIWIVVANSWMQTPAGFHIVGEGLQARAEITDFWAMVFNPSSMDRLLHTLCGAWQAGAFLVVSVSAWYLLKKRHEDFARASLRVGLMVGLLASLLQVVSGHSSAVGVAKNQPAKLAAFEGLYETTSRAPLALFGWVDDNAETIRAGVAIPGLLSWLVHGDANQPVKGLREFKKEDRPPVNLTFQFYHLMVMAGMGLVVVAALGVFYLWRGSLFEKRWLLWLLVLSVLGPQVANQAGWFAAEIGRQPWIVYGLLRTSEGLSAVVSANAVLGSLVLFTAVYALLFAVFLYLLNDKIQHGPDAADLRPSGKLAMPGREAA